MQHPVDGGDTTTILLLRPDLIGSMGADEMLPLGTWVRPANHLQHRQLLTAARRGDRFATEEYAINLFASVVDGAVAPRCRRSAVDRRRRAAVDQARSMLIADPAMDSVVALSREVGLSPHHLSRIFAHDTGRSLSTFRTELRIVAALDLLAAGAYRVGGLADIAAECGFADHAHMTRTFRRHLAATPSQVRAMLGG